MSVVAGRSYLLGLIGQGIGASRSPLLHESEAAAQGLRLVYRLLDTATLKPEFADPGTLLDMVRELGFDGVNVTHPYKQRIVPLLDELSDEASALGAVNTVTIRDGRTMGHNTDWSGFAASMRTGLPAADFHRVAQLGAGGAGAATAYAVLKLGAQELRLFDVDTERANDLAAKLRRLFPDRGVVVESEADVALRGADGVVQTTPVGMIGHPGAPIPPQLIDARQWVADIIYTPPETELLAEARKAGCRTVNGSGMLVWQAADALRLFTGIEPDADRMRRSLDAPAATVIV